MFNSATGTAHNVINILKLNVEYKIIQNSNAIIPSYLLIHTKKLSLALSTPRR